MSLIQSRRFYKSLDNQDRVKFYLDMGVDLFQGNAGSRGSNKEPHPAITAISESLKGNPYLFDEIRSRGIQLADKSSREGAESVFTSAMKHLTVEEMKLLPKLGLKLSSAKVESYEYGKIDAFMFLVEQSDHKVSPDIISEALYDLCDFNTQEKISLAGIDRDSLSSEEIDAATDKKVFEIAEKLLTLGAIPFGDAHGEYLANKIKAVIPVLYDQMVTPESIEDAPFDDRLIQLFDTERCLRSSYTEDTVDDFLKHKKLIQKTNNRLLDLLINKGPFPDWFALNLLEGRYSIGVDKETALKILENTPIIRVKLDEFLKVAINVGIECLAALRPKIEDLIDCSVYNFSCNIKSASEKGCLEEILKFNVRLNESTVEAIEREGHLDLVTEEHIAAFVTKDNESSVCRIMANHSNFNLSNVFSREGILKASIHAVSDGVSSNKFDKVTAAYKSEGIDLIESGSWDEYFAYQYHIERVLPVILSNKLLVKKGFNSIVSDNKSLLNDFLEAGADIQSTDRYGRSLLCRAIQDNDKEFIRKLTDAGATISPDLINSLLRESENNRVAGQSLKRAVKLWNPECDSDLLYRVARDVIHLGESGKLTALAKLDLNGVLNDRGENLLFVVNQKISEVDSISYGNIVEKLVGLVDVNHRSNTGMTPLGAIILEINYVDDSDYSRRKNQIDIDDFIEYCDKHDKQIDWGVKINGNSYLHLLAMVVSRPTEFNRLAETLLDKGVPVLNDKGKTPLDFLFKKIQPSEEVSAMIAAGVISETIAAQGLSGLSFDDLDDSSGLMSL